MSADINYVYAGKGWEPQVGDECEIFGGSWWSRGEIVANVGTELEEWNDYSVVLFDKKNPKEIDGSFGVRKSRLRRRRPPKQKDQASEDSFEEIMDYFKSSADILDEVEA